MKYDDILTPSENIYLRCIKPYENGAKKEFIYTVSGFVMEYAGRRIGIHINPFLKYSTYWKATDLELGVSLFYPDWSFYKTRHGLINRMLKDEKIFADKYKEHSEKVAEQEKIFKRLLAKEGIR